MGLHQGVEGLEEGDGGQGLGPAQGMSRLKEANKAPVV